MPALPSVPGVVKVQLGWKVYGDLGVTSTVFLSYSGGPPDTADAASLAGSIFTDAGDAYAALLDTESALSSVKVTDLSSSSGGEAVHDGNVVGTRSGGVLAGATCVLMNYTLGRRYRGGKPRNYFPFGVSSDLGDRQSWAPAFTTAVNSAWSSFIGNVIGDTGGSTTITSHVNVSYYEGSRVVTSPTTGRARNVPIVRTTPVVNPIVSATASAVPASQRRRNRG